MAADPQDYTPITADPGNPSSTAAPNTLSPTALTNNAFGFLEQFEGVVDKPYSIGGSATVGIGYQLQGNPFNEQVYLTELGVPTGTVYNKLIADFGSNWTSSGSGAIYISATGNLDAALNRDYGGTLPTLSATQEGNMWDQIVLSTNPSSQYEKFLAIIDNPNLHIDTSDLLNSTQGIALFSLSYNAILRGSHILLSDLNENNFNRADAWFQIRYNSDNGTSNKGSVAARRYAESELFGLYASSDTSGNTVTNTEALAIYAEFSGNTGGESNRTVAFNYENTYTAYTVKTLRSMR